ncbi:hypothetical protein EIO_2088 [Ketogulonicigenium vulgare Y25]|uniref:Uncharacterized protein n=2 Tax=Ketogulonicigenium vulgare TaxID=92945 RepID=F9YAF7_KETVW|nr:hypothetical protein EIO_2088 [Ketogulonicigenium vulgare Y25]AEM41488.1 hypothetical protein KVU_1649 [Ketogulonicigenium vulgare WSH-001]ALJ82376.1 hypothetical protein KVH_10805 [Ketogulonicigenium vulgare]ANW35135.1 hypothetical protein KvSKV_10720 [Ketogulonicigenium vulgare]AOZ55230.1 hypothetical protein KVC_2225 [Ketogulonicigenium vulgare]
MSLINQTVGLGWWSNIAMVRYVEGSMFLRATMDVPHGRRIYQSGMIRLPS